MLIRPAARHSLWIPKTTWMRRSSINITKVRSFSSTFKAMTSFQAWRVEKQLDGSFRGSEQTLSTETDLPAVVLAGDKEE